MKTEFDYMALYVTLFFILILVVGVGILCLTASLGMSARILSDIVF